MKYSSYEKIAMKFLNYEKKTYVCENYEKTCLCLSKALKLEKL
jgi:hypothetical protein